jgi:hypothetical protein
MCPSNDEDNAHLHHLNYWKLSRLRKIKDSN